MSELFSSQDELMGSITNRPKLVILNTISGSSLMSLILRESDDSYLVALPAKLLSVEETGDVEVDPYLPVPYARFFKTSILFVTPIFGTFEYLYLKYLLTEGIEDYPEALSDDDVKCLLDRLNVVTEERGDEDDNLAHQVEMEDGSDVDYLPEDIQVSQEVNDYLVNLNNKYKH